MLTEALTRLASVCRAVRWTIMAAAPLLGGTSVLVLPEAANAKTPGSTYCFYDTCHRVRSIAETEAMVGKQEALVTSFYDDCSRDSYNPCGLTSSGERFRPNAADNAASPIYPDGTTLLIFNPATNAAAVVRVNNAGPYWGNRKLDVSKATAEKLGFKGRGVAKLQVRVIKAPTKAESKYVKNRRYQAVPGYLGKFKSPDEAHTTMAAVMALEAIAASSIAPVAAGALVASRLARVSEEVVPAPARKKRKVAELSGSKSARKAAKGKQASLRTPARIG